MSTEKGINRLLTHLLGIFWLIDGILQLQPAMFTSQFVQNILKPNLQNQPQLIANLISFGIKAFSFHMRIENFFFALIQISIGLLLILPVTSLFKKFALYLSLPWCFIIWIFGEGLGNLLTGSASFYTGAPGSVLLYAILALFLLFPQKLHMQYLPRLAGFLFFLGGLLNELPMFWIKGMETMLWQMSYQDPIKLITLPAKYLSVITSTTSITNWIAISIPTILGILLLVKPTKILGWIAFIFLSLVWWVSQDFGGILTFPFGTATDPNSAPIFALFLLPLFVLNKRKESR